MNRKYNQKNALRDWKKKKRSRHNQRKKDILIEKIQSGKKATFTFWKQQGKAGPFGANKVRWKFPGFLSIGCLIIIILVIPTMIVFPFGKSDHPGAVTVATDSMPNI